MSDNLVTEMKTKLIWGKIETQIAFHTYMASTISIGLSIPAQIPELSVSYGYFPVEKYIAAFTIFRGQYQKTLIALKMF